MIAQAAEKVVDQEASLGPKGAEESEAVRAVVAALMHELECILHEYLSFNWDRAEDIYDTNKKMLHSGDLPSLWKSSPMLSVRSMSEADFNLAAWCNVRLFIFILYSALRFSLLNVGASNVTEMP